MNDLLSKSFIPVKNTSYVDLKKDAMRDLEMGDLACDANSQQHDSLGFFFQDVNCIKTDMEKVKQLLSRLQTANEESKTIHKAQAMKALREKMEQDVVEVLRKAKAIKTSLEELDKANVAGRQIPGCELGTPTDRTRVSITCSLRKKLKDLMSEFQVLREKMIGEYRETVERRYYTVTGEKPDEHTVEHMIETGESESFLQTAILEQGRGQVLETIKEIQERHDAVKEVEKNLLELHQIFMDMAVLVEAQGEHMNDIEHYVSQSNAYIDRGTQQLKSAKKYQRSSRKCMCIAMILILILILIVVIPIAVSFKNA